VPPERNATAANRQPDWLREHDARLLDYKDEFIAEVMDLVKNPRADECACLPDIRKLVKGHEDDEEFIRCVIDWAEEMEEIKDNDPALAEALAEYQRKFAVRGDVRPGGEGVRRRRL